MATRKESASKKTHEEADSSKVATEFDAVKEIDNLLKMLQGDQSGVKAEVVLESIDQWLEFLDKSKELDTKEVVSTLKDLKKTLKGGKENSHEIGDALIQIGEQTNEIATNTEKGAKQSLQSLGKQFRKFGTSLSQAEAQEYHNQFDSLLDKVDGEEITSLDAKDAMSSIDFWYNALHKVEGEQFKSVANSLKSLKQALSKDGSKPETIAKTLLQMGNQMVEIASKAPPGFKGVIQKLGKQITTASQSLTAKK